MFNIQLTRYRYMFLCSWKLQTNKFSMNLYSYSHKTKQIREIISIFILFFCSFSKYFDFAAAPSIFFAQCVSFCAIKLHASQCIFFLFHFFICAFCFKRSKFSSSEDFHDRFFYMCAYISLFVRLRFFLLLYIILVSKETRNRGMGEAMFCRCRHFLPCVLKDENFPGHFFIYFCFCIFYVRTHFNEL